MKTEIVVTFLVLSLFFGCGETPSKSKAPTSPTQETQAQVQSQSNSSQETVYTNSYGINTEFGTPPSIPQ